MVLTAALVSVSGQHEAGKTWSGRLSASIAVESAPASGRHLRVWIPIPKSDSFQSITNLTGVPKGAKSLTDPLFGNPYVRIDVKAPFELPLRWTIDFDATRKAEGIHAEPDEPEMLTRWLAADSFAPIDDGLRNEAARAAFEERSTMKVARSLYDFTLDRVEWRAGGEGVGRGNPLETLRSRRGDAFDMTSLFVALVRSLGIPARTHFGILFGPDGKAEPHAWAAVVTREFGWVPVDVGLAGRLLAANPGIRDACFGTLTENRLLLSTSLDLVLERAAERDPPAVDAPPRSILPDPPPSGLRVARFDRAIAEVDGIPLSVEFTLSIAKPQTHGGAR